MRAVVMVSGGGTNLQAILDAIRDGKISSEMIMKQSYRNRMNEITAFTESSEVQDEYSILDRAGRVQIPHEILDELNLEGNKVKLELQDGKVVFSFDETPKTS